MDGSPVVATGLVPWRLLQLALEKLVALVLGLVGGAPIRFTVKEYLGAILRRDDFLLLFGQDRPVVTSDGGPLNLLHLDNARLTDLLLGWLDRCHREHTVFLRVVETHHVATPITIQF
mmetsp:Transcript_45673/g.60535  ORF Transcript_45673/g.60535 Transcript_45673/m.60535 type:complete len:118 (-) Transcript_45673:1109-1462(-)